AFVPAGAAPARGVASPVSTRAVAAPVTRDSATRSSPSAVPAPEPASRAPAVPVPPATERDAPMPDRQASIPAPDDWPALIERAGLRGAVGALARNATLLGMEGGVLRLAVRDVHAH